jgi:hypothetical protein
MEFLHHNYLINYSSNISDFRINIYNQLNNKKYELIETELVKKYKEIGINIFDIITSCFDENNEDTSFETDDKDISITLKIIYGDLIKLSLNIPNILCEYKEATILDLQTKIIKLQHNMYEKIIKLQYEMNENMKKMTSEHKLLKTHLELLSTELDIGDYVKVPKNIDSLIICKSIGTVTYNLQHTTYVVNHLSFYSNKLPINIKCIEHNNHNYNYGIGSVCNPSHPYHGFKSNNNNYSLGAFSPNEFYQNKETPFICFKDTIDCELISNLELVNLGLFNIKIKNIHKLSKIKNLYLTNVEFIDDNVFNKLQLNELGIKQCKTISSKMLESINNMKPTNIYTFESNIKKTDLTSKINVIEENT